MINIMLMKCGLGNQMFTYAYARYLQEIGQKNTKECFREPIAINAYQFTFGKSAKIVEERQLSLQNFKLDSSVRFLDIKEQETNQREYLSRRKKATSLVDKVIKRYFNQDKFGEMNYKHRFKRGLYVSYQPYSVFETIRSKIEDKYVFGYYQNVVPLLTIQNLLKEDFRIITPISDKNKKLLKEMQQSNAVCLHIRRGDYLIPECQHLNICDMSYYQRGIDYMLKNVESPIFYIFSNSHDDLIWIKENYKFVNNFTNTGLNIVYVDMDNADYEDLNLMMECKHFVISNSTFSWWAAFLSMNNNKIVCMPDRWSLNYLDDANMYVPGWIKVQTRKN